MHQSHKPISTLVRVVIIQNIDAHNLCVRIHLPRRRSSSEVDDAMKHT